MAHHFKKQETRDGGLAQLGERLPCKQEVTGSIPVLSTISKRLIEISVGTEVSMSFFETQCTLKTEHCEIIDAIMRRQQ